MTSLNIDASDFKLSQEIFIKYCAGVSETFNFGNKIGVDEPQGTGEVDFLEFNDGISMIIYDCNFYEGLKLEIDTSHYAPLYLFYPISEGVMMHCKTSGITRQFRSFQPVIVGSVKDDPIQISFPKNKPNKLLVLKVDRQHYAKDREKLFLNREVLNSIFADFNPLATAVHVCSPNLHIADLFQKLSHHTLKEAYGIYILEAEANLILGHILTQYVVDMNMEGGNLALSTQELEKVRQLAHTITQHPGEPYTIKQLSNITGLNPYKLQEGFKHLYKRTAADFIRDQRLKRAAELLRTNEYNVTQVVTRIGLSSNSYFTKIFKDKYNYCPKNYQDQFKQHVFV
ncbi:MAG TPA: AraC family transcriptional regulator [Leeuwenhoekiella sp.]|nr:AraC family transcriptional regulator [Leeuwenhoekiella sp.]